MKFSCLVKTVGGQPDFKCAIEAPNQGVAEGRARAQATQENLTPTGRVKAIKVQE